MGFSFFLFLFFGGGELNTVEIKARKGYHFHVFKIKALGFISPLIGFRKRERELEEKKQKRKTE